MSSAASKSFRFLLTLLLLLPLLATACGGVAPVVKVGLVAPFEGRHRSIGYDVIYSARLAVREINAAGGIDGTRVALVALDDSGTTEFAAETAASLIVDPEVVAVVGHWLPETTLAAAPVYEASAIPWLPGGQPPLSATDPQTLSPAFVAAYSSVAPFGEQPGPHAAAAYEAYQMLWEAMAHAQQETGRIDRVSVQKALLGLK